MNSDSALVNRQYARDADSICCPQEMHTKLCTDRINNRICPKFHHCMKIGSALYRLSVQGTYRRINYEYKWVLRGSARTPHQDSNTEQQVCQTNLRAQLLL